MKINITYTAEETEKAAEILHLVRSRLPAACSKTSSRHSPYLHIYISIPPVEKGEKHT